jgi:hypothetical protein
MAYAGQVLDNPVSGERITFRKTASDTGGELLEFDLELAPDGHVFANGSDETAHVRVQVRPALDMERLFETAVALAEEGRTTGKGMPKPLDLALFVSEFADEVQGAFPPVRVQRATLAPLAWIARKRGKAERYASRRPAYAA